MKKTKEFNKMEHRSLDWCMHNSWRILCVLWKDKQPVLLISTSATPTGYLCILVDIVPRRSGVICNQILTLPVLVQCTTHIQGVDVANQYRAAYSSQTWLHKWWHRIWYFLLDMTEVNMYMLYMQLKKEGRWQGKRMTHLQFKTQLCEALLESELDCER